MFVFIGYPCFSKNCAIHNVHDMKSLVPIISDSVEPFALSFCLLDFVHTIPSPTDITPPACPLWSLCNAKEASVQVYNTPKLLVESILGRSIVNFKYPINVSNFSQLSVPDFVTLVHKNEITKSMSNLALVVLPQSCKMCLL